MVGEIPNTVFYSSISVQKMFVLGKPLKLFGCSFSVLVFVSAIVLPWKVAEAQLGKKHEIGNLLAAGIIAAVLGMHHKRRHAEERANVNQHHHQEQQETVLVPVPMHPMASATMRHPYGAMVPTPIMSPTQLPPFFMRHPMMSAPMPWAPGTLEHMAAVSTMQRLQQQQMPPALATYSSMPNPLMAALATASLQHRPVPTLTNMERMQSESEPLLSVREIHPTSALAETIEHLIRQLERDG